MLRVLVVFALCCWAVAAAGTSDLQVQLADQAEQRLRAGDMRAGVALLDKAAVETSSARGEDRIGFLYAVAGEQDQAQSHFRKSIAKDAKYGPAHYHLGVLLWLAKDPDQALKELQTAAALDPKSFDFRYRLGSAYVESRKYEQAVAELKAALAVDGTSADAWQQLGLAQQRKRDLAPAVAAYAKAVELKPGDDSIRNAYAGLLIETRQPERGIAEAQTILAHNKADSAAQMNVGYGYLKMGDYAKAEKAYAEAVNLEPNSAAPHYDLAIALKMQDQIEAAKKELERTIELAPGLAAAHYTLGITNWQAGDFPGTIEQMKAAVAIQPDYAEAHYMLGIAMKQSGDLDGAMVELKASIKLDPTTPGPYNTLGQILRIKGDKKGSEEAFAAGAKLKRDKDGQLANSLEQGMRGGVMPTPMTQNKSGMFSRRDFVRSVCAAVPVFGLDQLLAQSGLGIEFINVAKSAGLTTKTIFGAEAKNKFLLETTGCGVAFVDYDDDGWLDIFLVNGSRFETNFPKGSEPVSRLYKNNRDGTFTDVTLKAGVARHGWGQGVCAGDFNNDGHVDLFVSYWGDCSLWRNNGDGTFTDIAAQAGVTTRTTTGLKRWNTGCAFVDYDRDGQLDLYVANYIDFDPKTAPLPESGPCLYEGLVVACGPPGLQGGKDILFHNNGNGTFTDVSVKAGILKKQGTYSLGVLVGDFDNDGWPDIYVADDSSPSTLFKNNQDGTFTDIALEAGVAFGADGKTQAGMGVSAADVFGNGRLEIVKTNFAGDTSTLYKNLGNDNFEDMTFQAGLGRNTRFLGWGISFLDFDNDGWPDILTCNGHVYPEVREKASESGYRERKVLYHNLGNGKFQDVSLEAGPGIQETVPGRGCAIGDFDNDGDLDVVVNCVNDVPQLLRCDSKLRNNWVKVKTVGVKSNRSGIGARVFCKPEGEHQQMDEVRSGGSYISQSDLRVHFGVAKAAKVDIEVRWPSGVVDKLAGVAVNQVVTVVEGKGG